MQIMVMDEAYNLEMHGMSCYVLALLWFSIELRHLDMIWAVVF